MIEWTEILIRLSLAAVLGSLVGLERERLDQAAGMRTHMMVCLGSALIMIVSMFGFADMPKDPQVRVDVARVAAQVVSGIGFLGAGTIFFLREKIVRGLTTAAGLWTVAAIGLAVGGGLYFAALMTTIFAITILLLVHPIEKRFIRRYKAKIIKVVTRSREESSEVVNAIFQDESLHIEAFTFDKTDKDDYIISLKIKKLNKNEFIEVITQLQTNPHVKEVLWDK